MLASDNKAVEIESTILTYHNPDALVAHQDLNAIILWIVEGTLYVYDSSRGSGWSWLNIVKSEFRETNFRVTSLNIIKWRDVIAHT